jgi:hypothetical protein
MQDLSKNGAKIVCVAFPPQGGNSWSVVNDQGGYFNRNIPDEAHMFMGFFSSVYGPVRIVAFDTDGSGWSVTSVITKAEKVCDATRCVAIADVYRNISAKLDGNVVGYACCIGNASLGAFSHGQARTGANAPSSTSVSTRVSVDTFRTTGRWTRTWHRLPSDSCCHTEAASRTTAITVRTMPR